MAVEFVATVGTTDYSFDWVTEEITIEMGVTIVEAVDLKQAIHDAQDEVVGMYRAPIATFGNPVTLTGTSSTFLNVILQDGWKINSFAATGTLTVGGGNVVSLNDGIDIFGPNVFVNFVNNTSSAGVYVTGAGAGLTAEQATQLLEVYALLGLESGNPITITPAGVNSDDATIDIDFTGDGVTSTVMERQ
jgi:hypothetical protein